MEEAFIREWNNRVGKKEKVYVLGDLGFMGIKRSQEILSRLRGYKIMIVGNHDHPAHKLLKIGFKEVYENHKIELNNGKLRIDVLLSHFPYYPTPYARFLSVIKGFRIDTRYLHKRIVDKGEWLLHGHIHNAWKVKARMINCGVDVWNYAPVSHDQILKIIGENK